MQNYEIIVSGRSVRANSADTTLVRTSIGIDKLHVLFDSEEWLSFPVKVTFANGETLVTASLTLSSLESDEWAAESECAIPWEVIQDLGGIRVTFQGTDSSGNHIITEASGTPLTVVEAGDVADGTVPTPAPTVDEWNQAYADAMQAASDAASVVSNFQGRIDEIVAEAEAEIGALVGDLPIATTESLGTVQIGDGLTIDADGLLSADETDGMTPDQVAALANLRRLASYAFDSTWSDEGDLQSAVVKSQALPIATSTTRGTVLADGESIEVGSGGTLSVAPDYMQEQLAYLSGALKYKGTAESVEDLPDDAVIGDVYLVDGATLFWDGEDWAEISSAVDLSAYELSSNLSPITAEEVHAITSHHGSWGNTTAYVTQATLDTALANQTTALNASFNAKAQEVEDYLDEQLEAILDGSY